MSDHIVFGDAEPEDAWHPDDSIEEQIDNLERRMTLLDDQRPRIAPHERGNHQARLDNISRRLSQRSARAPHTERESVRVEQLLEDIRFVDDRIRTGG